MLCNYWDSGWCYKPDSEYTQTGCVGSDKCHYLCGDDNDPIVMVLLEGDNGQTEEECE